jgi:DNA-binding MarR family transcriptional regulator
MAAGRTTRNAVARFVARYAARHGRPPSLREIAAAAGCSTSTAHTHLQVLEAQGRIRREPGIARSVVVAGAGADAVREELLLLASSFNLRSAHHAEFIGDEQATPAVERALRAAACRGYARGVERALELLAASGAWRGRGSPQVERRRLRDGAAAPGDGEADAGFLGGDDATHRGAEDDVFGDDEDDASPDTDLDGPSRSPRGGEDAVASCGDAEAPGDGEAAIGGDDRALDDGDDDDSDDPLACVSRR